MSIVRRRVQHLEAQRQQALEAEVRRLEDTPRVALYLDAVPRDELRLLAQGAPAALHRFAAACGLEVY